jgi:hypothetical protein
MRSARKGPLDPFQTRWNKLFADKNSSGVDVIASFGEDFLSDFLRAHFVANPDQYKIRLERDFNDHNTPRKFTVELNVTAPLRVYLPPFSSSQIPRKAHRAFGDGKGWVRLPVTSVQGAIIAKDSNDQPANIRVVADANIRLRWPKLGAPGEWVFPEDGPLPLNCLIEGFVELKFGPTSPEHPEHLQYLQVHVRQIKFEPSNRAASLAAWSKFVKKISRRETRAIQTANDEQKFKDLLIIAMNVAATEYAPKLVEVIPLPSPVIQKRKLYPALFDLGDKLATIGFSLDVPTYIAEVHESVKHNIARFNALFREDLDAMGGIEGFAKLQVGRRPSELAKFFPKSSAYVQGLQSVAAIRRIRSSRAAASTANLAMAVNEFLLDALAANALPTPTNACTDWWSAVVVRGRICHWMRLYGANVQIRPAANAVQLTGSVGVDIGGAVEGCVRNPLPCTGFKWECAHLSLSVVGTPSIALKLVQSSDSIAFAAQLGGRLTLATNLPFPFNKVVEAIGDVVWLFLKGIINAVIAEITFNIVPPKIDLGSLNVSIQFANLDPTYYERQNIWSPGDNYPDSRRRFLACSATGRASKVSALSFKKERAAFLRGSNNRVNIARTDVLSFPYASRRRR